VVRFLAEARNIFFLFATVSRPVLGPTQPHIVGVPRALSLGVKLPGREYDYSPPPSAEVLKIHLHPRYIFIKWCLVKHGDNFIFTFTLRLSSGDSENTSGPRIRGNLLKEVHEHVSREPSVTQ
jgi:hypothetical protein